MLWGNYGYTAMVQTPDGKGLQHPPRTRIGPNNGVVSSITERGIIVQERFTDVYGNKQEREYVKPLHPERGYRMKQSQVGVHPLLSVTVMAGTWARRVRAARDIRRDDRIGRVHRLRPADCRGCGGRRFRSGAHGVASSAATLLTKVEVKPEGERLSLVLTGNGVFEAHGQNARDRRMVLDMPHMQSGADPVPVGCRSRPLSRVRFGYHQDKVRLVLIRTARRAQRRFN